MIPGGSPVETIRAASLCIVLALFVPAGLIAKASLAPLFGLLACILLLATGLGRPAALLPARAPAIALAVLVGHSSLVHAFALTCASCAGRAVEKFAVLALLVWATSCGAAGGLDGRARRRIGAALSGGLAVGTLLLLFEFATGGVLSQALSAEPSNASSPLVRYNRATSALVLLAWPAAAWLWQDGKRALAALLVGAVTVAACAGESASAATAAVLAVVVCLAGHLAPRLTLWSGAVLLAALAAGAPWLFAALLDWVGPWHGTLSTSALHRTEIWHAVATAIFEAPVFGHGVGATRELDLAGIGMRPYTYLAGNPVHPHNLVLQLWLDLGAAGLACAAALLWCAVRPVRTLTGPWYAAALAATAAGVFTALVSYGLWQETWLGMIGMTLVAFRALAGPGPGAPARTGTLRGAE